ncbi:MAG: TraV family lipoprotein [Nitrospirae bacterium]|nr:TraV family lipoprotein [Nitrospirota bacterium]
MDKVVRPLFVLAMVIFAFLNGCGTSEIRNDAVSPAIKDKASDAFNETVALLEKTGSGAEKIVGYATPGMPLRLPGRVIRIYVTPMKSPLGRLIGEHYVWAIVQEESWWTPAETGLDTIVPTDVYRKHISDERKK